MSADDAQSFIPGPTPNTVRSTDGKVLTAPAGWVLLPPGDAGTGHVFFVDGEVVAVTAGAKLSSDSKLDAEQLAAFLRSHAPPLPDALVPLLARPNPVRHVVC